MALRIDWDMYEVALLIEACEKVIADSKAKPKIVAELSTALRKRAERNGITIDSKFRNQNGIHLQMTKIAYLLTNGTIGLPGASEMFVEMVNMKKSNPTRYNEILQTAKQQIQEADERTNNYTNHQSELSDDESLADRLYVALKNECEINKYGATISFLSRQLGVTEKEVKAILSNADWAVYKFGRYTIVEDVDGTQTLDLYNPVSLSYTRPICVSYFNEIISRASTWKQSYLDLLKILESDYPYRFEEITGKVYSSYTAPLVGTESNLAQFRVPKEVVNGLYVETNVSTRDIISNLKKFLDVCSVDYENVLITYERKRTSRERIRKTVGPQKPIVVEKRDIDLFEEEFKNWMETKKKLGRSTCQGYVSAIRSVEKYAKEHQFHSYTLMTRVRSIVQKTVEELYASENFLELNKRLHHLYSAAINQLLSFVDYCNGDGESIHKDDRHHSNRTSNYDDCVVRSGDRILNYFLNIKESFPEFEFTNKNARGEAQNRAVYIYQKNTPRKGNVLFEIWQLYDETKFDLYIKKVLLSEEEYKESLAEWNKTSKSRGRITRRWYHRDEMIKFLIPKLEKAQKLSFDLKSDVTTILPPLLDKVDLTKYECVLNEKFQLGFRLNSTIELKKFKRIFSEVWGDIPEESDEDILLLLRSICIEHDDRLYLVSSILDKDLEKKILFYIFDKFQHGKKIIYIDALYQEFSDEILSTHSKIYNVEMLRLYLCHIANDRFYVFTDFISNESNSNFDITEDLKEFLLLATKPVEIEMIYQGLSHVSQKEIKNALNKNGEFINNGRNYFFHVELLGFTDEEIKNISFMIRQTIDERDYISGNELYQMIKIRYPYIVERNPLISVAGLRDGLKYYLFKSFLFEGNIISDFENSYSITKIFTEYGKKHSRFTFKELEVLAKELGTQVPLYAVNKNAIKVSQDDFVSVDQVHFQVGETDSLLEQLCTGDYISIQSITEFSAFPYAGFPWNSYLLEQFLTKYSERFTLVSKGINRNVVAGGIVRKTSGIIEFDDLLINVLASSGVPLKKELVLLYLVQEGYLVFAAHKTIEEILIKAKAKRNIKGK